MRVIALVLLSAAAAAAPALAQQDYPNRNVTIVNPTLAGSTTDGLARALAVGLASRLGQQFVITNNAGGAGAIGTAQVARAEPDGYTLLFGAVYVLSVLPALRPQRGRLQVRRADAGLPDRLQRDGAGGAAGLPIQVSGRSRHCGARQSGQAQLRASGAGLDSKSGDRGITSGRQGSRSTTCRTAAIRRC